MPPNVNLHAADMVEFNKFWRQFAREYAHGFVDTAELRMLIREAWIAGWHARHEAGREE